MSLFNSNFKEEKFKKTITDSFIKTGSMPSIDDNFEVYNGEKNYGLATECAASTIQLDHTNLWNITQSTELNQSRIIVDSITSEIDGLVDHLIEINSDIDAESSDEELEYSPTDQANICINKKCKKLCTKSDVHLWKGCDNCEAWVCGSKSCNKILTMHMRTHTKK